MTTSEDLIKAGFKKYDPNDLFPPIYWKTEGERTIVYYQTDGGKVIRSFDGLTKIIEDKVEEWEEFDGKE